MDEAVLQSQLKPRFKLPRREFVDEQIAQLKADLRQLQKLKSILPDDQHSRRRAKSGGTPHAD